VTNSRVNGANIAPCAGLMNVMAALKVRVDARVRRSQDPGGKDDNLKR